MDEVQRSIIRSSDKFSLQQDIKKLVKENDELKIDLAESRKALREIAEGKWTESGDILGASWSELKAIAIAKDARKGGK